MTGGLFATVSVRRTARVAGALRGRQWWHSRGDQVAEPHGRQTSKPTGFFSFRRGPVFREQVNKYDLGEVVFP